MYKHILVPTDGSLLSARTVSSAVEFAREVGGRVTFLFVEPDVSLDLYGEAALLHSMDPERFEEKYRLRTREILAKAEASAWVSGVSFNSVSAVSNAPHEVIIEVAEREECDLIHMSSRGRGGAAGMMIGSETLKTLMHTRIPVLVFSVGANAAVAERALSVIQDEHQAICAVARQLKAFADLARRGDAGVDTDVIRHIVSYFRDFPAKHHHPKEDDHLFAPLAKRTHTVDREIADLKRQHQAESRYVEELAAAVDRMGKDTADRAQIFADLADAYVEHTCAHMRLEEEVIFPAARKYLTNDDWKRIDMAFAGEGVDGGMESGVRLLRSAFARIVNLLNG